MLIPHRAGDLEAPSGSGSDLQLQPGSTVSWGLSSFLFCGNSTSLEEAIALTRQLLKADPEWGRRVEKGTYDSH